MPNSGRAVPAIQLFFEDLLTNACQIFKRFSPLQVRAIK